MTRTIPAAVVFAAAGQISKSRMNLITRIKKLLGLKKRRNYHIPDSTVAAVRQAPPEISNQQLADTYHVSSTWVHKVRTHRHR